MSGRSRKATDIISSCTIFVLFVLILSLVVLAARGYSGAVRVQDNNSNARATGAYITGCVRDSSGEVSIETRSGTECIVISGSGYEQIFYVYDGSLVEEYGEPGGELSPEDALVIGRTEVFEPSIDDRGLLYVRTDQGTACIDTER